MERVRVGRKEKRGEEGRRGGRAESEEREERDKGTAGGAGRARGDEEGMTWMGGEGRERMMVAGIGDGMARWRGRGSETAGGGGAGRAGTGGEGPIRMGVRAAASGRGSERGRGGGVRGRGREDRHRRHEEGRREEGRRERGRGEWEGEERRGDGRGAPVRAPNADAAATPAPAAAAAAGGAAGPGAGPAAGKAAAARDTGRTGGAYIPPFKLARMLQEVNDRSSAEYQRLTWDALRKSINGLVNKVNASNIKNIIPELFAENLVRGRGLLCRACIKWQMASPTFTHVFAALVAVVNTKFPELGELLLKRIILQFRRAFRRNDKPVLVAACRFLAHLVNQQVAHEPVLVAACRFLAHLCNQQVAHEIVALELLTLLLETPTDDSVEVRAGLGEVAVSFVKECGAMLQDLSPQGLHSIFERFRGILHEGEIDKRVQFTIEGLFAIRKAKFEFTIEGLFAIRKAKFELTIEGLFAIRNAKFEGLPAVLPCPGGGGGSDLARALNITRAPCWPHAHVFTPLPMLVSPPPDARLSPSRCSSLPLPMLVSPPPDARLSPSQGFPARLPELDLIEEEGRITTSSQSLPCSLHAHVFPSLPPMSLTLSTASHVSYPLHGLPCLLPQSLPLLTSCTPLPGFPAVLPELDLVEEDQIKSRTSWQSLHPPGFMLTSYRDSPPTVFRPPFLQGFPAVLPELDLVEEEDQITHELSLEEPYDPETSLGRTRPPRRIPPTRADATTAADSAYEGGRNHRGGFRLPGRTRPPRRIPPTRADATTAAHSADEGGRDHRGGFPLTDALPRVTRRIRGRTRTYGRRGASADGRAPTGDEAHQRTDAHPRATRRIRGRTRTRGRRGASADGRAPAGDEAHPRTDAHPRATKRIRGRTRTRGRRSASAGDEAHPRTDAHPRATRRIRGRTHTRERRGASADGRAPANGRAPAGHEAQSRATQTQLRVTRRHHTLRDRTTLPSGVVLFDRTRPQAVHDDNPDRWGANLNIYNRLRDTYTLQREAHRVAEAAHADATARLLYYAQHEKDYAEELRKIHKDVAAWRIADRRALAIIFSCIPSHLKRDLRPTSSSGLWKTLSTQYDRQDLRSLLALFRKFQDITLDSSPTAAAYTRRLIDTAQRLNDRGIVISESLLTARILDCLPPTYDTYRITFTSRYRHPPPVADTIEWLLDSEADIQPMLSDHSHHGHVLQSPHGRVVCTW
ncbi:unnamed protein product [Closterium sp. NIES-65]|nr:unnamed protein product [Closterium sp. NIES-65]